MIEKLTYVNDLGEQIVFSQNSTYHVNFQDITGLSDIRNTIFSVSGMGQDGDLFLGSRIDAREIDITGVIRERKKDVVQVLRRTLTHVLNPKNTARLVYECGEIKRVINCVTENAPVFKRQPIFEQFSINLVCLNPFWSETTDIREDIALWRGSFEFPEPGGLELQDEVGWEIGYREPSLIVNVSNLGDVPSGMKIVFYALGVVENPSLLNVKTGEFIKFNLSMDPGDVLSITTGYGEKTVTLLRNHIESNAFRSLDVDSTYIQLASGDNLFRYDADSDLKNLEIAIYHKNLYMGV